jgi:CubicO group peptidase (beta-lactamase class C family)
VYRVICFIAAAIIVAAAGSASASDARVTRIKAAFADWAARHGVENSSLAIVERGSVLGTMGLGGTSPDEAQPVASLSKVITGICVQKLVESGRLRYDDRIGKILKGYFQDHPPKSQPAESISVSSLLTQTSGISFDPTQGAALRQFRPYSRSAASQELTAALAAPLGKRQFRYNNVNYAALGLVIEAVTGEPYGEHCAKSVLAPVGITQARLNPDWMVMGAFGAWMISAEDFAKLLAYYDPKSRLLSSRPTAWPKSPAGHGASYSLGTFVRPAGKGFNFWHFSGWERTDSPRASFGAYFAYWNSGIGVVVNYQPTVPDSIAFDLDESLYNAALR